ncbi:MAG: hypothetical protein UW29_C0006G0051 [Candidatus Collierbacteria bacterium GW2011_GWC2_44_13]|nr:MAG: hypothetical protein UW29_C0006G0051 [Candidatus Collierbacteria bacterium GW2011_GWC2_44_13]
MNMNKIRFWVTGAVLAGFLALPFLVAWLVPSVAAVWTDWKMIVVFGILGAAVASLFYRLFEVSRPNYEYQRDRGFVVIKGRKIDEQNSWLVAEDFVFMWRCGIGDGVTAHLNAGDFRITREQHGFCVKWTRIEEPWELKY